MTDIAITARKTPIADTIREALTRLKDWLNEEVYSGPMPSELSSRDWADLPVHHPAATPDGKGVR